MVDEGLPMIARLLNPLGAVTADGHMGTNDGVYRAPLSYHSLLPYLTPAQRGTIGCNSLPFVCPFSRASSLWSQKLREQITSW